jgi:hypothetical protein
LCFRVITLLPDPKNDATAPSNDSTAGTQDLACMADIQNASNLLTTEGLQPLTFPLEIKAFTKLPVVVSAQSYGPGKPLSAFGVLYLAQ